jgi:dipeptidyl aminopeptidase/acylaminoacyl peptidase
MAGTLRRVAIGIEWGGWPSAVSPDVLAEGRISFSGLALVDEAVWWSESRPAEGGRQAVLCDGVEVGPHDVSIRSRVHEYGGGAWALDGGGGLVYVDAADQSVYLASGGSDASGGASGGPNWGGTKPERRSGTPPPGERWSHGDVVAMTVGPAAGWIAAVRERHLTDGPVVDEIVAVPADRDGPPVVLCEGSDFFAAPRPSPDGSRLAWLCWDHPDMPWDGSRLWVGTLERCNGTLRVVDASLVAGGREESVGQPTWGPHGDLWFVSDRRGWWQPYRWTPGAATPADPVCSWEAEFHSPDWVLGQRTLVPLDDGGLLARVHHEGRDRLVRLDAGGRVVEIDQPVMAIAAVSADGTGSCAVLVGATETAPATVHVLDLSHLGARADAQRSPRPTPSPALAPDAISRAEPFSCPTVDGSEVHSLFYPPVPGAGVSPPREGAPPLVVLCHGGPTSAVDSGFDPAVQFWTSRGVAVASVDYRGSSGYGRAFRTSLDGQWGVADAEDVAVVASALAGSGRVDRSRMAVRGSSSGGLTALRAAAVGGPFAAAVIAYGVTDLAALASDTHKFEAHYLDRLVGPLPRFAERYDDRSPARHPEQVGAAVLLLQGAEDAVVPPDQAARMAEALRSWGIRCDHVLFPDEGHGFRRADTVAAAAQAELRFLGEVLGFRPASDVAG